MTYRPLDEIFDAILSINENAAYEFAKKFSAISRNKKGRNRNIVLFPNVQYLFGNGKYSAKFEEGVRDDNAFPAPDELYLYEKAKHGPENWKNIGEVFLV